MTPNRTFPTRRIASATTATCATFVTFATFAIAACTFTLTLTPLPAHAQHQKSLDNNLQVGSNGRNPTVTPSINSTQNLITGNVGGLGFFRGNVPYTDTRAFRGSTADDSFFQFRARNLPSNVSLSTPSGKRGVNVRVFRTFDTPNSGSNAISAGGLQFSRPGNRTNAEIDFTANGNPLGFGTPTAFRRVSPTGTASIETRSFTSNADGQLVTVGASPLLGIRVQRTQNQTRDLSSPTNSTGIDEINAARASDSIRQQQVNDGSRVDTKLITNTSKNPDPTITTNINDLDPDGNITAEEIKNPLDTKLANLNAIPTDPILDPTNFDYGVAPAIELGQRIKARINNQDGTNTNPATDAQRLDRMQSAIFAPLAKLDNTEEAAQDPYLDLLKKIQDQKDAPNDENAPQSSDITLDAPDQQAYIDAEKARIDALVETMRIGKTTDKNTDKTTDKASDSTTTEDHVRKFGRDDLDPSLGQLVDVLDYDLPRVETLVGSTNSRTDEVLRDAEQLFASERYSDAESRFRAALEIRPDSPLIRVGLIHAQLGGGLIRSATYNMRKLFESHPELIATRYDDDLLPSPKRLQIIRDDLEKMAKQGRWVEPSLMLAYLGYQTNNTKLTTYGLNLAQIRAPKEPLIPLLRTIWLEEK